ncbi:MAG: DUF1905 domain-containing protein [Nonomuraea sp.]|nr:DUF1905 domain-containing protein [Nonomuraea sp.]
MVVEFDGELWIWDARRDDSWTFVSLPVAESEEIQDLTGGVRRGFGSLRVRVTVGGSAWKTSIFPGRDGRYALPIKKAVRKAEGLEAGDVAAPTCARPWHSACARWAASPPTAGRPRRASWSGRAGRRWSTWPTT